MSNQPLNGVNFLSQNHQNMASSSVYQGPSTGSAIRNPVMGLERLGMPEGLHPPSQQGSSSASGAQQSKMKTHPHGKKTKGRVKIKMEFIDNKLRRYTTFSKRKAGLMKKAFELSTLTGTEVMLLVASETGHVYTFATRKLQPMIASEEGKKLIQTCLNANPNGCSDSPSGGAGAGGTMDDGDGPMEHRMNLGTGGYDEEGSDDEEYGEFDEEEGDSSNDGASPPNTVNSLANTRFHSATSAGASGLQNLDNGQSQYSQPDYLVNQVGDYGGLSPYNATAGLYETDLKGSGQPDGLLNGYDGDGNGVGSFGSSGALQESSRR